MNKKQKIHDGTSKKVYETDNPEQLILEFKDEGISVDADVKTMVKGKGVLNNQMSALLFDYLNGFHVPTHYVSSLSKKEMLVKRLNMIPMRIIIRNIAAGSLCKRYGLEEGKELDIPIQEYFLKDPNYNDPWINASHAVSFQLVTADELRTIDRFVSKTNAILKSFFDRRQMKLVEFQLEFGRQLSKLMVGDEISIDSCRLWDVRADGSFDTQKFKLEADKAPAVISEIKNRLLN